MAAVRSALESNFQVLNYQPSGSARFFSAVEDGRLLYSQLPVSFIAEHVDQSYRLEEVGELKMLASTIVSQGVHKSSRTAPSAEPLHLQNRSVVALTAFLSAAAQEVKYFDIGGNLELNPEFYSQINSITWNHDRVFVAEWIKDGIPLEYVADLET